MFVGRVGKKEGDEGDDESLIQTFAHPLIIHGHMSHIKAFGFFLHCPFVSFPSLCSCVYKLFIASSAF